MIIYIDQVILGPSKMLYVTNSSARKNEVDDLLYESNCDFAYITTENDESKILDSKELYPNKFTPEFYKNYVKQQTEAIQREENGV